MKKTFKIIGIAIPSIILVMIIGLFFYSRTSYVALPEMETAISEITDSNYVLYEDRDEISFTVEHPKKNIIFIPGGLVEPDSYSYLAALLAQEGYNVTIAKAPFNLAILNPWVGKEFLSEDLDNIVIGHSLGGVTASSVFSGEHVNAFVFLGSYPIKDVSSARVLFLEAEFDIAMDAEALEASMKYVDLDKTTRIYLEGANHAQYGWYGPQKGDGDATISTFEQQNLVAQSILEFIGE